MCSLAFVYDFFSMMLNTQLFYIRIQFYNIAEMYSDWFDVVFAWFAHDIQMRHIFYDVFNEWFKQPARSQNKRYGR